MARRRGPETTVPEIPAASVTVRPGSLMDAYDVADLSPATKGLWPSPPPLQAQPLVSIVILSLDGAELLDRLLASFQQTNTYPSVEIIVVDHGSTDGTLALLRRWAERLPVKTVARGANYGYSTSNNRGARLASGELLLFLNNDIVFTEDVLEDMVALLQDEGVGAVGLKQYQPALTPSGRRVYHLGVRVGWNLVERRLRPYHVRPNPLDARVSEEAAAMPAVTASIMLCRRADFLALDGFSEDYFYGLEDVDFCCRLRWRLGKTIVSLNSRSALHFKNSTRDRDAESRRPTEKINRRVLQQRCGYGIRREFIMARLDDDGSFTGARPTMGVAVDAETVLDVATARGREFGLGGAMRGLGWDVRYLPRNSWSAAGELDVYVAAAAGPRPDALVGAQPHLTTIRWLDAGDASAREDLADWDLVLCPSEETRAGLDESVRLRAVVVPPAVDLDAFPPGPARPGLECDYLIAADLPGDAEPAIIGFDPDSVQLNLRVHGSGWERCAGFRPYVAGPLERGEVYRLFGSAAVTLVDCALGGEAGAVQTMLEAVAAGSLPLANMAVPELFGEALPAWSDPADLAELLVRYCAQPQDRVALVQALRRRLAEAHTWAHRAIQLRELLRARLAVPRTAVKFGPGEEAPAAALALALERRGFATRTDAEADWRSERSIGDDVAVILPGAAACVPSADQINIRLASRGDAVSMEGLDAVERWAAATMRDARRAANAAEGLAGRLAEVIRIADQRRSKGPEVSGTETAPPVRRLRVAAATAD